MVFILKFLEEIQGRIYTVMLICNLLPTTGPNFPKFMFIFLLSIMEPEENLSFSFAQTSDSLWP